jgi:2,3-bisphosphoglycerate-independent phosphoglycerate mutase
MTQDKKITEPIEAAKMGVAKLKGFEDWQQLELCTKHDMSVHWEDVARVLNALIKQVQEVLKQHGFPE